MYGRNVGENTFTWEPSGGLLHAGLVMRDRETDSWWSIITNDAIWGDEKGTELPHLPGSEKATFADWSARHPGARVLSVEGKEHQPESPYDRYFDSESGFRKMSAEDDRLADKALLFGFHLGDQAHAIPHEHFESGERVEVGDEADARQLFLYRLENDSHYRSSTAIEAVGDARFESSEGTWSAVHDDGRMATFEPETRSFTGATELIRPVEGFDTYWYIWSLTNPETEVHGDIAGGAE